MNKNNVIVVSVATIVPSKHALLPSDGQELGVVMAGHLNRGSSVQVDFAGVRGMNTGFSNSMFVQVRNRCPDIDLLGNRISFENLSAFQHRAINLSLTALDK